MKACADSRSPPAAAAPLGSSAAALDGEVGVRSGVVARLLPRDCVVDRVQVVRERNGLSLIEEPIEDAQASRAVVAANRALGRHVGDRTLCAYEPPLGVGGEAS